MSILDYKKFLITEATKENNFVNLYLSQRFIKILTKMDQSNIITLKFISSISNMNSGLCVIKCEVSFIDITEKNDTVSFITSSKAKPILDKFISMDKLTDGINTCWISNRQDQRLARIIPKLFGKIFELKDIEDFVKNFQFVFESDKTVDKFEILKGRDIRTYYNGKKYNSESNGQLQKSCMKYEESGKFFKIYEDNPEKMNMLVLKDDNGKIYGRANIWYLDVPEGKVFMDRIYTTYDWQIKLFIDYAIKNNWIYKSKQIYGGNVIPVIIDGKSEKIIMSVNLKPSSYDYYPYVDTLQFYSPSTGEITNDVTKFEDENYLTLVLASGQAYQPEPDDDRVYKIDYLGRIVHNHFLRWSDMDKVYVHVNDVVHLKYRDEFVTPEHDFVKVNGMICLKSDTTLNHETGEHVLKDKF